MSLDYARMGVTEEQSDLARQRIAPWMTKKQFEAWIIRESGGQKNAVSSQGAGGITQIIPSTWKGLQKKYPDMGLNDRFDPIQNIVGGLLYLNDSYQHHGGNLVDTFSGYHGGIHGKGTKSWGPKTADYGQDLGRAEYALENGTKLPSGGQQMVTQTATYQDPRLSSDGHPTDDNWNLPMPPQVSTTQTTPVVAQGEEMPGGVHPLDMNIDEIERMIMQNYNKIAEMSKPQDPYGSYFSGMSNAQHVPYGGGLQQIASMFGGGASSYKEQQSKSAQHQMNLMNMRNGMLSSVLNNRHRAQEAKATADYRTQQQSLSREKFEEDKRQWNADYGYEVQQDALERQAEDGGSIPKYKDQAQYNTSANALRDDLDKQLKGFGVVSERYGKIKGIHKRRKGYTKWSGAEDLSLIFSVMKTEDPTSTVREGEAATAANAGVDGLNSRGWSLYNQLVLGKTKLAPKARQEHFENMNESYRGSRKSAIQTRNDYGGRAKRSGIFVGDIMGTEVWEEATTFKQDQLDTFQQWKKAGVLSTDSDAQVKRKMRAAGFIK